MSQQLQKTRILHTCLIAPTGNSGYYFADQRRTATRISGNSSYSFAPLARWGTHQFKIGAYFASSQHSGDIVERPIDIVDMAGHVLLNIQFPRTRNFEIGDVEKAYYAQDHWIVTPRFALDLGFRIESQQMFPRDFEAGQFDLVYSIGVLAEHVPLQPALIARVRRWLRPGGRFAFSTVHPLSESIPRTWPRRAGALVAPLLPASLARGIRERLLAGGLYADEERVRELLADGFVIESLERVESEAHLHCLCVARTVSA